MSTTPDVRHAQLTGTLVFVDISGFTRLSERLARLGKVGAEELTDAIGTCFSALLGVAYDNGGTLLKFGGDALLLFFSDEEHPLRACRAAVGMRRRLDQVGRLDTEGGRIRLRMSAGVHSGEVHFFLVGDSHRELIITGPAASETVGMESAAEPGQILLSRATAATLPESALGAEKGAGRLLRTAPAGVSAARTEPGAFAVAGPLAHYIPVAVRALLDGGLPAPEHRRVAVAFVRFDGTDRLIRDRGAAFAAEHLDVLVRDVQRAVDRHGVSFLGSDIDHGGGKLILAAGAPVSHGDDAERMLLALREVVDGQRGLPVQIGVSLGHVFAGDIGPAYRRTYTVMGDTVNVAARLMGQAVKGEILATAAVLENTRTQFAATALEPLQVKGKRQPVAAYRVGPVTGSRGKASGAETPLVGREDELGVLLASIESARRGSGCLVEIVGEAGVGKSRLVEELRRRASDVTVHRVGCEPYESSTPYAPLRRLLRALLGIPDGASNEDVSARLHDVLRREDPELLPWAPLLTIPLDVELPDTAETAQLEDQFRRGRLHDVMSRLLGRLLPRTTLLTVEDAHWLDEASADLLAFLARHVAGGPWLICVTRRDADSAFVAPDAPNVTTLRLAPLDARAAAALVDIVTDDAPLAPHELAALVERSGGNPLFLAELVTAARVAGGVDALPDSVEGLITARIDRLQPTDRNALRYLAVLGQTFARDLAEAVLPADVAPDGDALWERLVDFLETGNGSVRFRHSLIRDAAYERLPYRLRRSLHTDVGETLEKAAGDRSDEQAGVLSFHFFHAHRYAEAWRYALAAAERAQAFYANVEAAQFYKRALEAAKRNPDLGAAELTRIYEALGDVHDRMGAYAEAATAYRAARRHLGDDPVADARLMLKVARVRGWLGRYSDALRWISRGLGRLDGNHTEDAARQRVHLTVWYGRFCEEQGRHPAAMRWCQRALEEAEAQQEREALALAYRVLGWASLELGHPEGMEYAERALALCEELGDLLGQASVLNVMGASAYWQGRWDEALTLYQRAHDAWKKSGDEVGVAFAKSNMGEILSDQGKLAEAETLFREALRAWQAAGRRSGVALAQSNLALVTSRMGRHREALRVLENSHEQQRQVGAQVHSLETQARMAECHLLQGEWEDALRLADSALEQARTLGGVAPQSPALHRIRGYAHLRSGRLAAARASLEESLNAGRSRDADYEIALTLYALAALLRMTGADDEAEQMALDSSRILQRLGVVRVTAVPLIEGLVPTAPFNV